MEIVDWGLVEYSEGLRRQEALVESVASGAAPNTLVYCSHPAVVTIGRQTPKSDFSKWKGQIVEVSRGGRATFHGPNQLVIYPIVNLASKEIPFLPKDLHAYIRYLGQSLEKQFQVLKVKAQFKMGVDEQDETRHLTGLWVGDRKLASIGIAVRKWVTFHGVAINFYRDEKAFKGISPCGFKPSTMISLEEILGQRPDLEKFKSQYQNRFLKMEK